MPQPSTEFGEELTKRRNARTRLLTTDAAESEQAGTGVRAQREIHLQQLPLHQPPTMLDG
ncbi:hypothetical protein AB5J72_08910 [Streptomyces sp. CG1]|uniref:hypothetical protein n=1 Tax=Streptomyces sp. CG1 TaxID=1287523 RepID=UPI0034E275E5